MKLDHTNTRKILQIIAINFTSSEDNDEKCAIHLKSDNVEITINDKADEVLERFQSLLSRQQIGLKTLMKGNIFFLIVFIYSLQMS